MDWTNPFAFFKQYDTATEDDVKVFLQAVKDLGTGLNGKNVDPGGRLNLEAAYKTLRGIQIGVN